MGIEHGFEPVFRGHAAKDLPVRTNKMDGIMFGNVSNMLFPFSYQQTEFIAIDK